MRIGFDMDGVLCDFPGYCVAQIRKELKPALPADYQQIQFNFTDILGSEGWFHFFHRLLWTENLWYQLPAYEHEVAALRAYIQEHSDDEIFYITARPPSAGANTEIQTQLWLPEQGLGTIGAKVLVTEQKVQAIIDNAVEFYVDDLPTTVAAVNTFSNCRGYVLRRPYNENWLPELPRVESVADFLLQVEMAS